MSISASAYQSPTMFGAIAPTTANMLAEAGANLTKQIEEQNVKLEAQLKAPAIGQIYADSLTRIAKGDFDGFKGIAEATAQGAGNPFLMSIFKDFDSAATRLAQSHMESKFAESRQLVQERMASERLASSERQTTERVEAQESGANNRLGLSIDSNANSIYKQELGAWDRSVAEMKNDYQKEVLRVQKHNEAENEIVKYDANHKPDILPEPPELILPPKPEPPQRTVVPSNVRPSSGRGRFAGPIEPDGQLFGAGAQSLDEVSDPTLPPLPVKSEKSQQSADSQSAAQLTSPDGRAVSPVGAQAPQRAQAPSGEVPIGAEGGIVNDNKVSGDNPTYEDNEMTNGIPPVGKTAVDVSGKQPSKGVKVSKNVLSPSFGSLTYHIHNDEKDFDFSRSITNENGTFTFKDSEALKDKAKKQIELAGIITKLDSEEETFVKKTSYAMSKGITPRFEAAGDSFYVTVNGKRLQQDNPKFRVEKDQKAEIDAPPVSKETRDNFLKAQGLMGELQGSFSRTIHLTKEQLDRHTEKDMLDIHNKISGFDETNAGRKEAGYKEITRKMQDEFDAKQPKAEETEVAALKDQVDKDLKDTLYIKTPDERKKETKDKETHSYKMEQYGIAEDKIDKLEEQLDSLRERYSVAKTEVEINNLFQKMRDVQKEISSYDEIMKYGREQEKKDAGSNFGVIGNFIGF